VGAPDLVAATEAALAEGVTVALVEQPYRVAGRRAPAPAAQLDAAWIAVVDELRVRELPLVDGGRSLGARVACRTAGEKGASSVPAGPFGSGRTARRSRACVEVGAVTREVWPKGHPARLEGAIGPVRTAAQAPV